VLLWLLRRRLGGIDGRRVIVASAKITGAALVMAFAAWGVARALEAALPGASLSLKLLRVGGGIGSGLAVLALAARALRIAEFDEARRAVLARLFPGKTA
jgi:peptidoglycan biosynthesis protein MviN/MurJ (putative lipid II flippase)